MRDNYKVPLFRLKRRSDLSKFDFITTEQISMCKDIIGQERGIKALKFGLSIKKKGYNVFVTGITGTGRNSHSYSIAKNFADKRDTPSDWCYVYNFKKPENPIAIRLKPGEGTIFKKKMKELMEKLEIEIPKSFGSKGHEDKKSEVLHHYQKKIEDIIEELNIMAKEHNFVFKQTEKGLLSIPLIDGRPMKESEMENLSEEEIGEVRKNSRQLISKAFDVVKKIRQIEEELKSKIEKLNEETACEVVDFYSAHLETYFSENKAVVDYLNEVKESIIDNIEEFIDEEETTELHAILNRGNKSEDFFIKYEVNLFIDKSNNSGAPVIREANPTYYNLLGKIEHVNELGMLKTDHTKIRPGAIHEANGGYLIIQAKDILTNPGAWEGLKRALITEEAKIENIGKESILPETIMPEPIPLDLKVIIIGDSYTYQLLYIYDDDFKKMFRIRADFDIEMDRSEENIKKIISFIAQHCSEEGLKPFHKGAIERILEYGSRLAEHQNKLTTRFNEIVEIMYEADAWADQDGSCIVLREHVDKAIDEKVYRNNKFEEKIQELIAEGTILINILGHKVGEINGLSVMGSGQYSFGRPNKITVTTYAGKDGIINIEREVNISGSSHDKGVMILSGYLGEKFATKHPLSLSASITFEQSYGIIDGDSASSTELYALLSSLSDIPINQGIAVTGSVNQKGMIQPIGGVNEKIEGYFKICKLKGLTGEQGVIIPHQNIDNLMLSDEVIEAVNDGNFSIYAIKTIDEGIEILTGIKLGKRDENGNFEEGTISYLVQKKLDRYAKVGEKQR
ncbi:peptidase S16, lon-like protein [Proteiniborus sp. DW1]|uniref:Lon protease family protein n=1 Tax=Proteiniborus sp. DW1 TaxID=1889883 RepID=UPI00092DF751|nr:ATP-binding protein [Proteiniborus sp. DW1]SCG83898.1 peptidase S16, lon-like protein [Proteiniborus sp. DW1]